jgi:hypothetical protein
VDEEVDEMVAEDFKPPEVVVEGEGEVGEESDRVQMGIGISDQLFQPVEGEDLDPDIGVVEDVGPVVKLERDLEGIGVNANGRHHHQTDGQKVALRKKRSLLPRVLWRRNRLRTDPV